MSAPPLSSSLPAKPPALISDDAESPYRPRQSPTAEDLDQPVASGTASSDSSFEDEGEVTDSAAQQPPLPAEVLPPLPTEEPPSNTGDDGWAPVWDDTAQAFYFYNKFTQKSQWENPRVPQDIGVGTARVADTGPPGAALQAPPKKAAVGGYDPTIHGDYDPLADYAKAYEPEHQATDLAVTTDPAAVYAATGAFNRFTGKWQAADVTSDKFSDENKSKRQMNAFFDVDAAANSHDGRSLKAERSSKKISKAELKAYREKRKEKKEEKRRAWLRD